MKLKIIILVVFTSMILIGFIQSFAMANQINWQTYEQGIEIAKKQNKKIFLYFHADWCKYCVKMGETTFVDVNIVDLLNSRFIPIKVNADDEQKIAAMYDVKGLPNSWFLFEDAKPLNRLPGFVDNKLFHTILKYIATDSFQKVTFKEFNKFL